MADEDEIKSVRESGDVYLMWSVVLLLVVHLLIFPALVKEKKTVNQVIGNEVRRLDKQRAELEADLGRIDLYLNLLQRRKAVQDGIFSPPPERDREAYSLQSDPGSSFENNLKSLAENRKTLLLALQTNAEKTVLLSKSKYSRELKIPGTDTAIDESQIRFFYPTVLAVWFLVFVFRFRNPLYRLLRDAQDARLPLWCGPVPYGKRWGYWDCTLRNLAWFGVFAILARFFVNSGGRQDFFASPLVFGLNLTAGVLAGATCVGLLASSVMESIRCQPASGTN